jgi:uncharacterized sporulation protein YeaH/YhbH (DUF444 family)
MMGDRTPPVGSMSADDEIAALRSDMAAVAAERQADAAAHAAALKEIATLQAKAASDALPDHQIRAGIAAIRAKFARLFSR